MIKKILGIKGSTPKEKDTKRASKRAPGSKKPGAKARSNQNPQRTPSPRNPYKNAPAEDKRPPAKTEETRNQELEAKTITRLESMPAHESILSNEFGDVNIGEELRRDYVILLSNRAQKIVDIVRSLESYRSRGVDNNFLAIRQDLKRLGYRYRASYFASRPLIRLIYDKQSRQSLTDKVVENASDLSRDFERLLEEALTEGVSDIHIEVRRDAADVRMRTNGMLQHRYEWGVQYARDMAVVVYQVLAEEKDVVFVPTIPQDAVIDRTLASGRVRVRLATAPAYPDGFDMVMRILPMGVSTKIKTLSELGYLDEQIEEIERMMDKPVGALIISGVTGSGKSTSMATMLSAKIRDHEGRIKVITVENPPENAIPGATQCPVVLSREGRDGRNPFAAAIRAAMRSDPDVLMIGEVRDDDSAELLVHATQSGHQTITTLHTPSAFAIPSRLRSLGITNDVLGSGDFFSGLIYQTLVQVLCENCCLSLEQFLPKIRTEKQESVLGRVKQVVPTDRLGAIRFRNHSGCKKCESGIAGRTVVAEAVFPDDIMKQCFSDVRDHDARAHFLKKGGLTVLHAGIRKLMDGIVDPIDLEAKVGRLDGVLEYVSISGLSLEHFGYRTDSPAALESQSK